MIPTYQDFLEAPDVTTFVRSAIETYKHSDMYKTACLADEYDAQKNPTVSNIVRTLYTASGIQREDDTVSNHRIASNLFNRLNTQRCMYSLGSGVSFIDPWEAKSGETDTTKDALGKDFDHIIREAAYHALIHGRSYLMWDLDKVYLFKATEFVPFDDENTGNLMAGVRFWQLDKSKPLNAVLYEKDGFTCYSSADGKWRETQPKRGYRRNYTYTDAEGVISFDDENYNMVPIVRMYGSRLKQSTLIGLRESIDAFDLIQSGFANDLTDCAQIYWIVENYGGMDDNDLAEFLKKLKFNHVANADTQAGGKVTPYNQDIPYQARKQFLDDMRARIYEDFGALDVHTISAGSTNDHIDAAYQPLEENAADFEHWVSDAIVHLLELVGIDDVPIFRRTRISNQKEQVEMLVQEAMWLDTETILRKLPNITPDEYRAILDNSMLEDMTRIGIDTTDETEEEGGVQPDTQVEKAVTSLNGAQTQSLIAIMGQYSSGALSEGQAIKLIATAIGLTTEEARKILLGEME